MRADTLGLRAPLASGVGFGGQLLKLCICKYAFCWARR